MDKLIELRVELEAVEHAIERTFSRKDAIRLQQKAHELNQQIKTMEREDAERL